MKTLGVCLLAASLASCGVRDENAVSLQPDSTITLSVDGQKCEPECRSFSLVINGQGKTYFNLAGHSKNQQKSPREFEEMLAMLDELKLLELRNARYAERPGVDRSHCEPGKPRVQITDPRDVRVVEIDMGCPEHIEAGKRLVAALAELAGATEELGEWPER